MRSICQHLTVEVSKGREEGAGGRENRIDPPCSSETTVRAGTAQCSAVHAYVNFFLKKSSQYIRIFNLLRRARFLDTRVYIPQLPSPLSLHS